MDKQWSVLMWSEKSLLLSSAGTLPQPHWITLLTLSLLYIKSVTSVIASIHSLIFIIPHSLLSVNSYNQNQIS